jgi:ParB family transcriptional regulator, chromosome partitioning protein
MAKKTFKLSSSVQKALGDTVKMANSEVSNLHSTEILVEKIKLDPENPRRHKISVDEITNGPSNKDLDYKIKLKEFEGLRELSASIQKEGLLNPITVVKEGDFFKIVAGERRFLATLMSKKTVIESRVFKREPNSFDLKVVQWMENAARKDLTLYNKLMNVSMLMGAYKESKKEKITAIKLSQVISCSRQQAQFFVTILSNSALMKLIEEGVITTFERARGLASCITREEILKKLNNEKPQSVRKDKSKGPGRKRESISFGQSKNISVGKVIFESVLNQDRFKSHATAFDGVDWTCMTSSTKAFQRLIKILENEFKG